MTKQRELPKDLVEEILCHVPATNLKQLRSTCKPWNRLFNDSRFAQKHFDKAAKEFLVLMLTKDYMLCPMRVSLHGIVPSVEVKSELTLLDPHYHNLYQFDISRVFHCDGLLLCTSEDRSRIMVWNPCTGQTRWIDGDGRKKFHTFVLGYCQDNKSCSKSYKILSFYGCRNDSEIYELSSNSWRILNHDIAPGWCLSYSDNCMSLKGDTYVFATDETEKKLGISLLRFDFSTEKFVPVPLPCNLPSYVATSLSVVKEEKISVLLQHDYISKTEIWVTNKIDETKVVSWSKVLALDLSSCDIYISQAVTFLLDEKKNVVVCCETWTDPKDKTIGQNVMGKDMVYIIGEDSKATRVDLGEDILDGGWPIILNYVPSFVQIDRAGGKRKRAD